MILQEGKLHGDEKLETLIKCIMKVQKGQICRFPKLSFLIISYFNDFFGAIVLKNLALVKLIPSSCPSIVVRSVYSSAEAQQHLWVKARHMSGY